MKYQEGIKDISALSGRSKSTFMVPLHFGADFQIEFL